MMPESPNLSASAFIEDRVHQLRLLMAAHPPGTPNIMEAPLPQIAILAKVFGLNFFTATRDRGVVRTTRVLRGVRASTADRGFLGQEKVGR
jgi:hypothetical protein